MATTVDSEIVSDGHGVPEPPVSAIDVSTVRDLLAELTQSPYLVQRRDALVEVSRALGTADAQAWARVDLGLVFSDDSVVDPEADFAGRRVVHAENARNISILAPLLITWYGIATATWAYGRQLDRFPKAARSPFIQLWEQGFGGTSPWWVPTFSFIGLLDFIAIGVVIGLSIRVASRRRTLEVEIPEREAKVRNKLRNALAQTAVLLARDSLDSPTHFNDTMNTVAARMEATEVRLVSVASEARKVLEDATGMLGQVGEVADRLVGAADQFATGLRSVETVLDQTRLELQGVASHDAELASAVATSVEKLAVSGKSMSSSTDSLVDAARSIGRDFNAGSNASDHMVEAATRTSEAFSTATDKLVEVSSLVAKLEANNERMGTIIEQSGSSAKDMSQAAGEAKAVAESVSRAIGTDIDALPNELQRVVQQLQQVVDGQALAFADVLEQAERRRAAKPRGLRRLMFWRKGKSRR